ncbi:hypothetical protein BGZ61DRAFT_347210 [Ilyonectria robusta]|uniref:uncharacterized protein n=1 Tax=Ilyonectria robusta TaxID=1079257 RepID=UPI001E8E7AE4|nr:uncharacterized protein BGZ61DRAFT_347210 [Ilyonectria robusta]KAH8721645.1 hypothetical protein BGZ61DRAFT_347210 [Ilyonectria robusta]
MKLGFLGLGMMGTPMALNLARKFPLVVWNRSAAKYPPLIKAGATIGETPSKVVEQSSVIFTMLFDGLAIQSIFNEDFKQALRGKTLVNTSSVSVGFSHSLAQQVRDAGGNFIEMPVSGSKVPAEQGNLVGMMAGDLAIAESIRPVLEPITNAAVYCGPIGSGLQTKYAVNLYLVAMTVGLAESFNLARAQGLNLEALGKVLEMGPMASAYSKIKVAKIIKQDWSAQASIKDCHNSTQLIQSAAKAAKVQSPLLETCGSLYEQAKNSGLQEEDMIAIVKKFSKSWSEDGSNVENSQIPKDI